MKGNVIYQNDKNNLRILLGLSDFAALCSVLYRSTSHYKRRSATGNLKWRNKKSEENEVGISLLARKI